MRPSPADGCDHSNHVASEIWNQYVPQTEEQLLFWTGCLISTQHYLQLISTLPHTALKPRVVRFNILSSFVCPRSVPTRPAPSQRNQERTKLMLFTQACNRNQKQTSAFQQPIHYSLKTHFFRPSRRQATTSTVRLPPKAEAKVQCEADRQQYPFCYAALHKLDWLANGCTRVQRVEHRPYVLGVHAAR